MAQFFFDTSDGDTLVSDGEGIDLPSRDEARAQALATLSGITEDVALKRDHRVCYVNIRDGDGRMIPQQGSTSTVPQISS